MHATPVIMELLVIDARFLGQQSEGFDYNFPPFILLLLLLRLDDFDGNVGKVVESMVIGQEHVTA